jgi:hypothetical protein
MLDAGMVEFLGTSCTWMDCDAMRIVQFSTIKGVVVCC